ncbi:hypothetical protein GDO78_002787 [Eleutherodactylus coqui]|uniref:Uncharacterized protein n=1 Tax=Eleutherodactylus coqui TaxID=57060 RepID=A0A8J6EXK8_ELECQ|nr:hypothetical protein GDO78_002787 [Eleutherodactylus coqui]
MPPERRLSYLSLLQSFLQNCSQNKYMLTLAGEIVCRGPGVRSVYRAIKRSVMVIKRCHCCHSNINYGCFAPLSMIYQSRR